MKFGKTELIRRISDVVCNGWQNVHVRDLIESLWRDPFSMRTSGFVKEGGTDAVISLDVNLDWFGSGSDSGSGVDLGSGSGIDDVYITFTIAPVGKKFHFYQFRETLSYHKKYASENIYIPAEEGLFVVYYDFDSETFEQVLKYIHNPDHDDMIEMMEWVVPITFFYFDADLLEVIYFGDNRHGSWWNPWIHFSWHQTFNSMRESGLEFTDLVADGDGSSNEQSEFGISAGSCFNEDIYSVSDGVAAAADLPVFYFIAGNKPRIYDGSVNSLVVDGLLCYNSGGDAVPATDGYFVMYHIFYTNCIYHPFISAMGQDQYENVSTASYMLDSEVTAVRDLLPHQNLLHIGTLLLQTSEDFSNTYHSRIVTFAFGVLTEMSVTGDGSKINKVRLVNDELNPTGPKYYGPDVDGVLGYHPFEDGDPRLYLGGQAIYLHTETSDVTNFKKLLTDLPDDAMTTYQATSSQALGKVLVKKFVTEPGYPGVNVINAGPWCFEHWVNVTFDSNCYLIVEVYRRDTGGTEYPIMDFEQKITATGITQYFKVELLKQLELAATTDRLSVYYYFRCDYIDERTISLDIEGISAGLYRWSLIRIPLPTVIPDQGDKDAVVEFGFNDVEAGTAKSYDMDINCEFPYTIKHVWLRTDSGILTGVNVKINSTAVTGLESITVTGTKGKSTATALNTVVANDTVTLNITTGYSGVPAYIGGHIYIERS
jgi:hypothetical protein